MSIADPPVVKLLEALAHESSEYGCLPAHLFGDTDLYLNRARVYVVGAHVESRLVGIGGVVFRADGVGELVSFYVNPSFRRADRGDGAGQGRHRRHGL